VDNAQRTIAQQVTSDLNKQPTHVDLTSKNRITEVTPKIIENLLAFHRAAIIIIILFVAFLISVPSIIVGSVARAKNSTCSPSSANWLIVFGCIGVSEAVILITFVSHFFQVFVFS
jgi:hypothetical protein